MDIAQMPRQLQDAACGRTRRSCIKDTRTGRSRLEVAWSKPRPSIHWSVDQGAVGFPGKQFLLSEATTRVRGWLDPDPAHRRWNNCLAAFDRSNLAWAKDEVLSICCFTNAPYGSKQHFFTFKEAAAEFFGNLDSTEELLKARYPGISFQMSGAGCQQTLAPVHMRNEWL